MFLGLIFLGTLYLSYYPFFEAHGLAIAAKSWPTGLPPDKSVSLLLVFASMVLFLRIKFNSLSPGQIRKFAELAQDLLWNGSAAELLALIDKNADAFFRILNQDYWHARLRSRFAPPVTFEALVHRLEAEKEIQNDYPPYLAPLVRRFVRLLPSHDKEQREAAEIARTVLIARPFVEALSSIRPYLGITILKNWKAKFERGKFLDLYVSSLMANKASILYAELANSEAQHHHRYLIPENNRLLHYLFGDIKVAKDLGVYRPIGEFVMRELAELRRAPDQDPYNTATGDFSETEGRNSSVYTAIHLFDIMILETLFQGLEWHMWLYYLRSMVDAMVKNYKPRGDDVDAESEWPIKYSWLISRVFRTLEDWIESVEYVPLDQANAVLKYTRADLQNSNIPMSSILALGHCVATVVMSDQIEDKFKESQVGMVFGLYFRLRELPDRKAYGKALINSVVNGGPGFSRVTSEYREWLCSLFLANESEYRLSHKPEDVEDLKELIRSGPE